MAGSLPYTGLRYKYRLIEENLDILPDYRVAEIGVGTGFSCFKIAQKAAYVCGIDIAEELIETLGEIAARFTNVTFLKADVALEDPPADLKSSMDVVISIDTLNHVPSTPGFLRYVAGL